jgi:hypothetical protein
MYVQDYGAPVGWRLALSNPASISAIVTQNGNGYEAGFAQAFWRPVREYWHDQNPQSEAAVRQALALDAIRRAGQGRGVGDPQLWPRGEGLRSIERLAAVDRKTVRRYVAAALECGVARVGGEGSATS